jgi:hypothetical protein
MQRGPRSWLWKKLTLTLVLRNESQTFCKITPLFISITMPFQLWISVRYYDGLISFYKYDHVNLYINLKHTLSLLIVFFPSQIAYLLPIPLVPLSCHSHPLNPSWFNLLLSVLVFEKQCLIIEAEYYRNVHHWSSPGVNHSAILCCVLL